MGTCWPRDVEIQVVKRILIHCGIEHVKKTKNIYYDSSNASAHEVFEVMSKNTTNLGLQIPAINNTW